MNYHIVFGAARGIGRAIALSLVDKGYTVFALDIDESNLETLKQVNPGRIHIRVLDFIDSIAIKNTLTPIISEYKLTGVILSHGIDREHTISEDTLWDKVMMTNLMSVQRILSLLCPAIINNGRVVMISSILGKLGKKNNSAYCASKHALLGITKALALELAERQITVNAVLPSWVDTNMLHEGLMPQVKKMGSSLPYLLKRIERRIPLGRLVTVQDVANTVDFLLSPGAAMITAQSIVIDGGDGCGL